MKVSVTITIAMVLLLAGCASSPNHGVVSVGGTTFDDQNWNGR